MLSFGDMVVTEILSKLKSDALVPRIFISDILRLAFPVFLIVNNFDISSSEEVSIPPK